jgi:hypothetical protein
MFAGKQGLLGILIELGLAGLVGLLIFGLIAAQLKVAEFEMFLTRIQSRLPSFLKSK